MRDYKNYYNLNASPADVYNAITNPDMIEIWTGEAAEMSTEAETEFSIWDGAICGKNLEFIENKLIKQEWYFGEEVESIVTIKFHANKGGTRIELLHTNIPDEAYNNIVDGWNEDYFGNLAQLFEA